MYINTQHILGEPINNLVDSNVQIQIIPQHMQMIGRGELPNGHWEIQFGKNPKAKYKTITFLTHKI